jgi:hypothetical protein
MIFTITSIGDEMTGGVEARKLLHQLSGGLGCQQGGDEVLWIRGGNNAAFEAPWADVCMCQRGRHRVIPDAPDGWAGRENDGSRNSRGQVSIIYTRAGDVGVNAQKNGMVQP